MTSEITIRGNLKELYKDIYTPEALSALSFLSHFNDDVKTLMSPSKTKGRTSATETKNRVPRSRDHHPANQHQSRGCSRRQIRRFANPPRPATPMDTGNWTCGKTKCASGKQHPNVAYALLSGADGWMFDGEDALGQINSMSLDNQRNLKLAIHKDPVFMNLPKR